MHTYVNNYLSKLNTIFSNNFADKVQVLAEAMLEAWRLGNNIYLCGNGGSAGNSIHLANDFIYGAGIKNGIGLRVEALSSNSAVLTCIANDLGYENIYSEQIRVKGNPNDLLIVLSGSGNSLNVVKAIQVANELKMKTFAIVGFGGGRCKELAQHSLHFRVDDMQIAEDLQLIVGHICMQWLRNQKL